MDPRAAETAVPIQPAAPPAFPVEIPISAADISRKRVSLELALARASRRERAARRNLVGGIALAGAGVVLSALLILRLALVQPTWMDILLAGALLLATVPAGIGTAVYSYVLSRMLREQKQALAQDLASLQLIAVERT